MSAQVHTLAERPDLGSRLDEIGDPWPEFIHHNSVVNRLWPRLYEDLAEYQLALVDEETGAVIGKGCTIPVAWDGQVGNLSGGVVDVLVDGFSPEPRANILCALLAVVGPDHQGRGLSGLIISGMAAVAERAGLQSLIAPVRPTWKDRHPLVPLQDYMLWEREDGLPFDPWLRLHTRLGAEMLAVAPRSLDITGTVPEWEEWTGMRFAEDGDFVVPGALVPVRFENGVGRYVEPNVWMRHEARG